MQIILLIFSGIIGAIFGSFACCQAHRLHYKELDKPSLGSRSVCLNCGHKLSWFENIPVFSWLIQKGKCKKCGQKIGVAEIIMELAGAISFIAIVAYSLPSLFSANSPMLILTISVKLLMVLFSITIMGILAVYDAKWQKLPVRLLTILNACAIIYIILHSVGQSFDYQNLYSLAVSVTLLAGIYYLLSKAKLVGDGDWLLALPIALLLNGHWWLAILELFLSNFLAAISMAPVTLVRNGKHAKIPFGPFLIIAFIIIYCAQDFLLKFAINL